MPESGSTLSSSPDCNENNCIHASGFCVMKLGVQRFVFCYCFACDTKIIYSNLRIEILGEFFEVSIFDSNCYFILIYNLCTFLQAISWMQKINNTAFGNSEI